jgi:hypothetical protein
MGSPSAAFNSILGSVYIHASLRNLIPVKSYPCNRLGRPMGLRDIEAPMFCLDNRLTDGDEVVSLRRWLPFTSRKIPGTSFC